MASEPLHLPNGEAIPDLSSALATGARQIHLLITPDKAELLGRIEGKLCPLGEIEPGRALALIESLERGEDDSGLRFEIASTAVESGREVVITPLPPSTAEGGDRLPDEIAGPVGEIVRSCRGLVLFSGPSGSGRNDTIASLADEIARSRRNVLRIGYGHVSRSRLAALDADCLVLQEACTSEEARFAHSLARDGYLVFLPVRESDVLGALRSCISAADSREQLARDMAGVLFQRRMARICPACGFKRRLSDSIPEWLDRAFVQAAASTVILRSRGSGCPGCDGSGYAGWTCIYEFVPVRSTDLAAAISSGLDPLQARIGRIPRSGIAGAAWRKISCGEIDIEELRHLPPPAGDIEKIEPSHDETGMKPDAATAETESGTNGREDPFVLGRNVLAECYGSFAHGRRPEYESILALATGIVNDVDAFPGRGVYRALDGEDRDFLRHHLNTAQISVEIGRGLDWEHQRLVRLAIAALLHGAGSIACGTDDRDRERTEPVAGRAASRVRSAFPDQDWLPTAIAQVEEREDGSGEPDRLSGDSIDPLAKVIGLADQLEALTHADGSQEARTPFEAIQFLMKEQASCFDRDIFRAMVRTISLFPVGSLVRLNNGSVARVVSINPENFYRPRVEVELDSTGRSVSHGETLDLADSPFIYITGPHGG